MRAFSALASMQGLDGDETGAQAAREALLQLGAAPPAFGLIFAGWEYRLEEVMAGVERTVGGIPLWGISTRCPLAGGSEQPRSVTVVLAAGINLKAAPLWLPDYSRSVKSAAHELAQALMAESQVVQAALLALDGRQGNPLELAPAFEGLPIEVSGCLVDGAPRSGQSDLGVGARQCGTGSLAGMLFGGSIRMGAGWGHGWIDSGVHVKITQAGEQFITSLDGDLPVEFYSRWLGRKPDEWQNPPLNELARMYPLGGRGENGWVRSPVNVEVDGSLRINIPAPPDGDTCLMIGSPSACEEALRQAARSARRSLGNATPFLAVALVDAAWRILFDLQPELIPQILVEELGEVPLAGGTTLGQVMRLPDKPYEVQNQQAVVILLGEMIR